MILKLSIIQEVLGDRVNFIKEGKFNSLSLLNGKLKKDNMLLSYIENEKYIPELLINKEITCVICKNEITSQVKKVFDGGIVATENPRTDFFIFHNYLNKNTDFYKICYNTKIENSTEIDSTVKITEKNVTIGKSTKIMSNVVIYENTTIGDNVIIREGSVIGSPAFYYFNYDGNNESVDSVGGVIIKDNVELNANTIISRGVLGDATEIGKYTKIDSNVTIAHDVKIKENCIITSGVVLAGAVNIGKNAYIGIGTNIVPMISIGENCMISAGSVVTKDVENNTHVSGNFAIPHKKFIDFIKKISEENSI